jgi:hypothetical protein
VFKDNQELLIITKLKAFGKLSGGLTLSFLALHIPASSGFILQSAHRTEGDDVLRPQAKYPKFLDPSSGQYHLLLSLF